jgi:iron complex outermembrane receptor protein
MADLNIEDLGQIPIQSVTGASRYEQAITAAPASISVATRDEIQKQGYRTLADVLNGMRGVYTTYDRNYNYMGIRGFGRPGDYNTRVLLLVDGHRMNDNVYDQASIGTDAFLDVDLIERVEVIRGPSSSIYGDNAFLGVINVITRKPARVETVEASVEGGGAETFKGRFSVARQWTNDVSLLVSGTIYHSDGGENLYYPEFNQPWNNFGHAIHTDQDEYQSVFASAAYHDLTLSGGLANRTKRVPTASYETVFDADREWTRDFRAYADLKWDHEFSEDTRLMGRLFYDNYYYEGDYPYSLTPIPHPNALYISRDETIGNWIGTEWQLTQKILERHTLVAGGEYKENLQQEQRNSSSDDLDSPFFSSPTSRSVGVYAQAEVVLLTNLMINAGLRYDHYSTFGGTVNPRVALIYSPWTTTTFKLLYGQAYRAPNAYELYYSATDMERGNPNLDPETIQTYELAYEQVLPWGMRLSTSLYYYEIQDLISQTVDSEGYITFANLDRARAAGVEFEVEKRHSSGLLARVSYAYQQARDSRTDQEISNSPQHLLRASLIAPLHADKLYTGVELQYCGTVLAGNGSTVSDYAVVNWTLFTARIVKGLEVSATVYNLFDTHYSSVAGVDCTQTAIEQDGRGFRLKATYRF